MTQINGTHSLPLPSATPPQPLAGTVAADLAEAWGFTALMEEAAEPEEAARLVQPDAMSGMIAVQTAPMITPAFVASESAETDLSCDGWTEPGILTVQANPATSADMACTKDGGALPVLSGADGEPVAAMPEGQPQGIVPDLAATGDGDFPAQAPVPHSQVWAIAADDAGAWAPELPPALSPAYPVAFDATLEKILPPPGSGSRKTEAAADQVFVADQVISAMSETELYSASATPGQRSGQAAEPVPASASDLWPTIPQEIQGASTIASTLPLSTAPPDLTLPDGPPAAWDPAPDKVPASTVPDSSTALPGPAGRGVSSALLAPTPEQVEEYPVSSRDELGEGPDDGEPVGKISAMARGERLWRSLWPSGGEAALVAPPQPDQGPVAERRVEVPPVSPDLKAGPEPDPVLKVIADVRVAAVDHLPDAMRAEGGPPAQAAPVAQSGSMLSGMAMPGLNPVPDLPSSPVQPLRGSDPAPPNAPAPVQMQILQALSAGGAVTELRLAPEELGHVRIEMRQDGDRLVMTVSAERQDTLDLLRRHASELAADLRSSGQTGLDLSFGRWSGADRQADPPAQPLASGASGAENPLPSAAPIVAAMSSPVPGSGLYLRI